MDPKLLSSLADLEFASRVVVEGTVSGLHRSPFHGYSAEFSQYRHYQPGDDLKYVDWKLFARTDRLYTKQFRETTNLACQLVVDASRSMAYADGRGVTKWQYARLVAGALAHLISGQGDAVGLVLYADRIRQYLAPRAGPTHLRALLLALGRATPDGETNAGTALTRAVDLMRRRGLLVLVSDLYDENQAVERTLERAAHVGHDVAVVHVLTPDELSLASIMGGGDVELVDLESGRTLLVNTAAEARAYRERIAEFLDRWRTRCATYGIDYVRLTTDMALEIALRAYVRRRAAGASA